MKSVKRSALNKSARAVYETARLVCGSVSFIGAHQPKEPAMIPRKKYSHFPTITKQLSEESYFLRRFRSKRLWLDAVVFGRLAAASRRSLG